ncbi:MAG: GGDEF domain-containing protein [Planctomycetota bacterium]|jgi:GGDEF domain-containing protein
MDVALLLPWFPLLLAVGVCGRLLGKHRGLLFGLICSVVWTAMAALTLDAPIGESWPVAIFVVAGALALAMVGYWSHSIAWPPPPRAPDESQRIYGAGPSMSAKPDPSQKFGAAVRRFDEWFEAHADHDNLWQEFDEFLRTTLSDFCHASHVRPYRLLSDVNKLVPLGRDQILGDAMELPARQGIAGLVATTGRSFFAHDGMDSDLIEKLGEDHAPVQWCFAIRRRHRRLGVVTVGQLDRPDVMSREALSLIEQLINLFWGMVAESLERRSADLRDPGSGLYVRRAFLNMAERSLQASYQDREPAAVAIIAVEGIRTLTDVGKWEFAEELIHTCADELRRKTRTDDEIGRFDDSRFVVLLKRVDSELAGLIVCQIASRLETICGDESRWGIPLAVRCGLAGSGVDSPDLYALVGTALSNCHRARNEARSLATDVAPESEGAV